MSDIFLTTIILLLAALTGFVVGVYYKNLQVGRLLAVVHQQHARFLHAIGLCVGQIAINTELRKINHGLGRALQDAGLPVGVIGKDDCNNKCEKVEVEWPEEL